MFRLRVLVEPKLPLRRRLGRGAGVTIFEVLAAAAILGVGLVGVGSMVTYGVVAHKKAVNYTIAVHRTTKELERIREAGYLGAVVGPSLFPSSNYTILSGTQVSFTVPELRSGTGTIIIYEDPEAEATNPDTGLPYANLKRAQAMISWGGGRVLQGSFQGTTLVANKP